MPVSFPAMPELPEVETLRRSLEPRLLGARITRVTVRRRDVVRVHPAQRRVRRSALLEGDEIAGLERHGKQMAIRGRSGRIACIHLGMSGQVLDRAGSPEMPLTHHHVVWRVEPDPLTGGDAFQVVFRDPRRFGGIWTYPDAETLHVERWSRLGPDALTISSARLAAALRSTTRMTKAALLDQNLVAGLGNIYVDEALFRAGIHPQARACDLAQDAIRTLSASIKHVLRKSLSNGGTTLRDYRLADGSSGRNASRLLVYGRGDAPCQRCKTPLVQIQVAQRTTTFCPRCQSIS